ncbi:MAG: DUF6491 family protein [Pseudomonadota bacterium]
MLSHRIAFAAMLFVVSACATATTPEQLEAREKDRAAEVFADDPRRGEQVDKVCFARQIDSFGLTTKRAVVIREGGDRYLVETFAGCFDLDWAQSLAIDSFTSCLSKGDRIFAFDTPFGPDRHDRFQQSCRVKAIYKWDRDALGAQEAEEEDLESEVEETIAR